MSRRDAREKAFMFLFQLEIQKGDEERQLAEFITEREVNDNESEYMQELIKGVQANRDALDERFSPLLKRWTKDRLPKVDLTILRLAVYELFYVPAVPANVAISEAVLLTKKYSSEESRSFINAILGRLSREISPDPQGSDQQVSDQPASDTAAIDTDEPTN
jgi:N utilization substance protein B